VTIQEALAFGRQQLTRSTDASLDARLLLEHVLKAGHTYLVAHREEQLSPTQEQEFRLLVERAARQEPIPYLVGQVFFFGRPFQVNPAVLIPRPETEQLVENALHWAGQHETVQLVDVGTGSGCIAITLALELSAAAIEAVDISAAALAVARENAVVHGLANQIRFYQGNLLQPITGQPNLIIANLPYIANHEWSSLSDGVKLYEPTTALLGGPDGLGLIRQLLDEARDKLAANGAIFLETGWQQGPVVQNLAQDFFPSAQVELLVDFAGHDRIISITQ
jgi:release factor glutamine methyltransferase